MPIRSVDLGACSSGSAIAPRKNSGASKLDPRTSDQTNKTFLVMSDLPDAIMTLHNGARAILHPKTFSIFESQKDWADISLPLQNDMDSLVQTVHMAEVVKHLSAPSLGRPPLGHPQSVPTVVIKPSGSGYSISSHMRDLTDHIDRDSLSIEGYRFDGSSIDLDMLAYKVRLTHRAAIESASKRRESQDSVELPKTFSIHHEPEVLATFGPVTYLIQLDGDYGHRVFVTLNETTSICMHTFNYFPIVCSVPPKELSIKMRKPTESSDFLCLTGEDILTALGEDISRKVLSDRGTTVPTVQINLGERGTLVERKFPEVKYTTSDFGTFIKTRSPQDATFDGRMLAQYFFTKTDQAGAEWVPESIVDHRQRLKALSLEIDQLLMLPLFDPDSREVPNGEYARMRASSKASSDDSMLLGSERLARLKPHEYLSRSANMFVVTTGPLTQDHSVMVIVDGLCAQLLPNQYMIFDWRDTEQDPTERVIQLKHVFPQSERSKFNRGWVQKPWPHTYSFKTTLDALRANETRSVHHQNAIGSIAAVSVYDIKADDNQLTLNARTADLYAWATQENEGQFEGRRLSGLLSKQMPSPQPEKPGKWERIPPVEDKAFLESLLQRFVQRVSE